MTLVLAHGLGDASALPAPLPLVLLAVGGAVLGLAALRSRQAASQTVPAGRGQPGPVARPSGSDGWLLPGAVTRVVDAPVFRGVLRAIGLMGALVVLWLAALGPLDARANPASRLVLVVVWAGIVPLSLVAPGAWRTLSPLRTLSAALARATREPRPPEDGVRPLPQALGWQPAAVALAALAALAVPLQPGPTALLAFLALYALVQMGAASVFGSRWYEHGEALEVLAQVVGRLSPVTRDGRGRLRLASPRARLAASAPPGALAVFGVLVGASLADFVSDMPAWNRLLLGAPARPVLELALLAAGIAVATAAGSTAVRVRALTPALLPVVTGYLFAHYFAVLLIEGQAALSQLGTLARGGLDALESSQIVVRYDLLPGQLAATLQLLGFLLPHLVAVLVASDLAFSRYPPVQARAALAPFHAVLAVSAVAGTALRYAAG